MKKLFDFKPRTAIATGLGLLLFIIFFMFVTIPTGIPETEIKTAYGIGAFFAAAFGPIAGILIGFIGHTFADVLMYGTPWWSWVIASGVSCFCMGLVYPKLKIEDGLFTTKTFLGFNVCQIIANIVAWVVVAPVLDVTIYKETINLALMQGVVAAVYNTVSAGLIGTLLLFVYSRYWAFKKNK